MEGNTDEDMRMRFRMIASEGMPDVDHEDMDRLKKESKSRTENENKQRKEWERKYMNQEELLLAKELEKARAMEQCTEIAAPQKVQEKEEATRWGIYRGILV